MHHLDTTCVHGPHLPDGHYGAISYPIYQTAAFAHPGPGESTGYDYSRLQNPTRGHLEEVMAALEGAKQAFALSSGMAAVALLMELFSPGDHLIIDADLYGGSVRLFDHVSKKNGLEFTAVDCADAPIEEYIRENTKAVYIETPTNPMMHVTDIAALAQITKQHNLLLIADNTFLSPYFQNPLTLGADVVLHSATKFLGGHNDTVAGLLAAMDPEICERLAFLLKTVGSGLAPMDSWLILRGIKTLAVRMLRSGKNALKIARWLKEQPQVEKVYYPGLEEHPGYEIMKRQARGFGSMITFDVSSAQTAHALLRNTQLIAFAESLGGTETLLTYPLTQTHADVPKDLLARNGITERTLRLSVGIENAEDLITDLAAAFAAGKGKDA